MAREKVEPIDRFRGGMLGLAVGDAMGAPLAGMKAGHVTQVYGEIEGFVEPVEAWKGRPHRWSQRGLYTGVTQRAMVLADILTRDGALDPRALINVYLEMAEARVEGLPHGCHRRVGRDLHIALEQMRSGDFHPLDCGGPTPDLGAAACVAPVGLYYANDEQARIEAAIESALVTHRDPRAIGAAQAVAAAVGIMIGRENARELSGSELAEIIADEVRRGEELLILKYGRHLLDLGETAARHQVSESIALLGKLLDYGDDRLAFDSIVRQANRYSPDHEIHDPGDSFAPAGIMTALYLTLGGRSFAEAVPRAVTIGREAADFGAIVGAIVGARFGVNYIPAGWRSELVNADQVDLRAADLFNRDIDYTLWRGIVDLESEATAEEERRRRTLAAFWEKKGEIVHKKPRAKKPGDEPAEPEFAPPPEVWLLEKEKDRERRHEREKERDRDRKQERRDRKKEW